FFKEFLRFQKNLSPCLTGLSWADIIKMQIFTVLQTVMFPCGTEERGIFYGKRSRIQLLGRSLHASSGGPPAGRGRDHQLRRLRHVRHGDEPPLQGVPEDL